MAVVTYFYICASCAHKFTANEAQCEDWRIPEKSWVCPKCNAYLAVKKQPYARLLKWYWPVLILALVVSIYTSNRWLVIFAMFVPIIVAGWNSEGFLMREVKTSVIGEQKI
jgi:uncharacterized paraquat-inducible protein A